MAWKVICECRSIRERIRQVLVNLLDNGIKFTHSGGITLNVSTMALRQGTADKGPTPPTRLNVPGWRFG